MGGFFANAMLPRISDNRQFNSMTRDDSMNSDVQPSSLSSKEKEFLKTAWRLEEEIKSSEKEGKWVRLYCLLQTVRHLCESEWKEVTESDSDNLVFINKNLLSLLHYVQDLKPESRYWPKVSDQVKEALEIGNLNFEVESFTFTFNGKPLTEEPWDPGLLK